MALHFKNKTPFRDADLRRAVAFVRRYTETKDVAVLFIPKPHWHQQYMSGVARPRGLGFGRNMPKEFWRFRACKIRLGLKGPGQWPHTFTYKKRAGPQTYNSWEEQLISIVAHELRHLDQYERQAKQGMDRAAYQRSLPGGSMEVDAEHFAWFVLNEWRKAAPVEVVEEIQEAPRAAAKPTVEPTGGQKQCPKCGKVGDIATEFGFRLMNGVQRPQSYCRVCRTH